MTDFHTNPTRIEVILAEIETGAHDAHLHLIAEKMNTRRKSLVLGSTNAKMLLTEIEGLAADLDAALIQKRTEHKNLSRFGIELHTKLQRANAELGRLPDETDPLIPEIKQRLHDLVQLVLTDIFGINTEET